jgi:membrane-associated phospholipid phosphatase
MGFLSSTKSSREYFSQSRVINSADPSSTPLRHASPRSPEQLTPEEVFMYRVLASLLLVCASLQAQVADRIHAENQPATGAAATTNPVIEWNRTLLVIVRTKGAQPATIHPTRSFAILHAAIYDAVNNINGSFTPYMVRLSEVSPKASQRAAADQAAHDVLVSLYPAFQSSLDAELQTDLAAIPDGTNKTDGIAVGQTVAADILAIRANDGSGVTPPPYVPVNKPGFYQPTPPNFAPADFTQWPDVTPFAIARADEFLPAPPPKLKNTEYTNVFDLTKSLGLIDSNTRTAEQTTIGLFWNGKIWNYWNEIAQTSALRHSLNIEDSARLFALLNISLADGTIAFYQAKYFYQVWRPVTAIIEAGTDGNPKTAANTAWLPLSTTTAPDPSYPAAHSTIAEAAATVLTFSFGDKFSFDVTSETLPGVKRHFDSFSAAAQEASLSRIYAGQHFLSDVTSGKTLGADVANDVDHTTLLPQ